MTRPQAAAHATKHRSRIAKAKVQNAINICQLYGKKINSHAVSIEAGVTRRTALKYLVELGHL
jgi:hypothetical protein